MPRMRNLIPGMTDMNDMLMGTEMDDLLLGGPGDDRLDGKGGSDVFDGGPGGDAIIGGDGVDYVSYIRSPAGVYVDIGSNFNVDDDDKPPVHGGYAEGDTITEVEGIFGSAFGDTFYGDHQANHLFGYKGNDVISGRDGADMIRGESGGDSLMGDGGNDRLYGDTGNDKLDGGAGNDMLWGGKGDDLLDGGSGHDFHLEGGEGADVHQGGTGSDTAAYTKSPEAVTINLKYAYDHDPDTHPAMGGHAEGDSFEFEHDNPNTPADESVTVESIENVRGSDHDDMLTGSDGGNTLWGGMGDDTLSGGMGADKLHGEMGADMLNGGSGDDLLAGGMGADMLEGGTGTDTADYEDSPEAVRIDLSVLDRDSGLPAPTFEGGDAEGDTNPKADIENLTGSDHADLLIGSDVGSTANNVLMGGKGDDWDNPSTSAKEGGLYGMGGNDTLSGGAGMDYLSGGEGRDDLWGGSGDDLILGGNGADTPFYTANVTDDDGTVTTAMGTGLTAAQLAGLDLTDATALAGMNITRAGLFGGEGNDTLVGGMGDGDTAADPAEGGDLLHGGGGTDTVSYSGPSGGATGVTVALGDGSAAGTGSGDGTTALGDILISIENVIGSDGNDTITGNILPNVLNGGDGSDSLTGSGGADTFVFERGEGGDAGDTITDFSRFDRDKIDLTDFELTSRDLGDAIMTNAAGAVIGVDTNGNGAFDSGTDTAWVTLTGVEAGDLSIDDFIL